MSLKKLASGSGYEYLTRQVAAFDSTELGRTSLADYYAAKGESPGLWLGSGLVGIAGISAGDVVTAGQMQHLFGDGCDPITGTALGRPYGKRSVAGFDLTFSPVKSVSALWAVASPKVAAAIREAHDAAVRDAIRFLEDHATFTREGTDGVRQVETRGLVAVAFTHRDSRGGDPDLHTHVAVANKVQTKQGRWLALYGTVLHQHVVAASEAYNTALEHHLRQRLGIRFIDVPRADGKRAVREIEGVDRALRRLWSRRRGDIEDRVAELTEEFTATLGRAPTSKEAIGLAQRANLETRAAKHEPRSEAEQRASWRTQAQQELGERRLELMAFDATHPIPERSRRVGPTAAWIDAAAGRVIAELESHRATWQSWHVHAEVQRQVRDIEIAPKHLPVLAKLLVDEVTARTINLTPELDPITEPAALRRSDGTSVYRHTGADHFTSEAILAAEHRIVLTAGYRVPARVETVDVYLAVLGAEAGAGVRLNEGQRALVLAMATDPRQVTLALAPAGSGKTIATKVLADAWSSLGYDAVGFAPSAAAAAVLQAATGMPTETLAKLDHLIRKGTPPEVIGPGTMVVIDEAGMADTPTLDRIITYCTQRGALVRLIGDDQQLAAVGAGGVLRDIATTHGAQRLEEVVRFSDPIEAQASLDLRAGDSAALGFYLDHDRIHIADKTTSLADVLGAWQAEQDAGRDCLMLAPTRELVARLNHAARQTRLHRLNETVPGAEVELADGNQASVGDVILTRCNDRRLGVGGTDWVKNGDRWTVTGITPTGGVRARHNLTHLVVSLPASYVAAHVELGYATTVHSAQGQTADVMHGILTGTEDRQLLYTMLTRGRHENHLHLVGDEPERNGPSEDQFLPGLDEQLTAIEALDRIVRRDGAAVSATTALTEHADLARQLHDAVSRYSDALADAALKTFRLGAADAADDHGIDIIGALEAAGPGPLPWLHGIPIELQADATWGPYLAARRNRVADLAEQVRQSREAPPAVDRYANIVPEQLRQEISLWRAATGTAVDEPRLLPSTDDWAAHRYGRHLQRQVDKLYPPQIRRWEAMIGEALGYSAGPDSPGALHAEHTLDLAHELDSLQRTGLNATRILRRAATLRRPLPEDHRVEALAYRVRQIAANEQQQRPGRIAPVRRNDPSRRGPSLGL